MAFAEAAIEGHVPADQRCARRHGALPRAARATSSVDAVAGCRLGRSRHSTEAQRRDRIRVFYLAVGPDLFGADLRAARQPRAGDAADPRGDREAARQVRRLGQGRERRHRQGLRRAADLPHRSLSRQGDGAEPDGAALRQCPVRADLELRPYRPRADHRGRDARRRGPRRLLRHGRRAARHGAEPHAAAALPRRHGAADLDRRRCGARREAEGAASR